MLSDDDVAMFLYGDDTTFYVIIRQGDNTALFLRIQG